jgi:hypothetical protein
LQIASFTLFKIFFLNQVRQRRRLAAISFIARLYAGHIRRPAPNGSSLLEVRPAHVHAIVEEPLRTERVGLAGARATVYAFTSTHGPVGWDVVVADHRVLAARCGSRNRATGCTPHRLLQHGVQVGRSRSVAQRPLPTTRSSSAGACAMASGRLIHYLWVVAQTSHELMMMFI